MSPATASLPPLSDSLPEPVLALEQQVSQYLTEDQVADIHRAYELGAHAHEGQRRKTGEPYIMHPVAVAQVLADMRLDHHTIVAAILHDVIEDTPLTKQCVTDQFGSEVSELVDGVTKLDKVKFSSAQEAAAESFRKMMLAMSRDIRVILIKLADRLHNMQSLSIMRADKRRRIAKETLEIYAPIAQRLGMNKLKAELQDLGLKALHPMRYRIIAERVLKARGHRSELIERVKQALCDRLAAEGIEARVVGRIKSPFSIYRKMSEKGRSFNEVMDVFGFRIVTRSMKDCYYALGVVHGLYKPMSGRFKDYIAIPKANGYQSLHSVLFGPSGDPLEIQFRTEEMDLFAESGIASHWRYKDPSDSPSGVQARARDWLLGLLEMQHQTGNSVEFLEHVKVDLFPDEVYVFTPQGDILQLPANSTAVDFAYAVHTDVGNHAVAVRVDRKFSPLRHRLQSGETIEIITAKSAQPSPAWLEFVATSRARTGIRHFLKQLQHEETVEMGHRMLDAALDGLGESLESIATDKLDRYLEETKLVRLEELLSDIAQGNRMPSIVAQQLISDDTLSPEDRGGRAADSLLITGSERDVVSYGNCCNPIPGDRIMGHLSAGKGIVVHRISCRNVKEFRKAPDRWIDVDWDPQVTGEFKVVMRVEVTNKPGVLAGVAAAIARSDSNIEHVEYKERDAASASLQFTLTARNRKHLAAIMRRVRRASVVLHVARERS